MERGEERRGGDVTHRFAKKVARCRVQTLEEEAALAHSLVEFVLTDGREEERASERGCGGRARDESSIN